MDCSWKESAPMILPSSAGMVIIVSVLRLVAVFSTMAKGCPGLTSVILKKEDPKSNPMTIAYADMAITAMSSRRL